ncbi:Planctomycete cytochrome C [Pirellula sp. SH-Sr6A]|uniref:DUF1553 domain-containing protein n=1 Tax=Pirellula sp. SH-Sr6A TaxID=1632865 RepID=UPI00078E31FA|nr:DUF1553 domain-containing protein [Pirellula sp. SH-Sr6A]AMV33596.1 Planctomycete cytochrome C [Pirellula sp. SH-Sr6A]
MKRINHYNRLAWMAVACIAGGTLSAEEAAGLPQANDKEVEFFERKVRPILVENCYICHSEHHKEAGGLRVDDFKSITSKGRNGSAVVAGNSAESILIQRVTHADDSKAMPPDHRLSEQQIHDLKSWIDRGAAWPPLVIPTDIDQTLEPGVVPHVERKESHWAWQPLKNPAAPEVAPGSFWATWARSDIDRFVASRLQEESLTPVADAAKSSLLRRLTFDLTGLPPTEQELLDYLLDESDRATEKVVDRLLGSISFGERWGRHWLDVARYGESTGSARNLPYPHAWRYRDYVIESFNEDKPFNQFLQEQIAGDLLPANSPSQKREQLIATGFLALGVKDVNQRFKVRYDMDNVDEQIDTVSKAVLGLTVSCARCHDHKFDPISTRDYYALAGIFTSTELCDALRNQMGGSGLAYYVPNRLIQLSDESDQQPSEEVRLEIEERRKEFEAARAKFVQIRDSVKQEDRTADHTKKLQQARQAMQRKQAELVALTDPAARGLVAIGVRDAEKTGDTEIRIRGEAEKLGPTVPRGFLTVLDHIPTPSMEEGRSGRYELAKWLTHPSNPLTTRVAVNRIWQRLFAEGLVRTVDNFGVMGDVPSHPELLDYLAQQFIRNGWSQKKLIREIVLSRTYQLSASSSETAIAKDPSNKWLWRHAPRRLDAEEIRDSILAISGELQRGSVALDESKKLPVIEIRNNGPESRKLLAVSSSSVHRSVYLPMVRGILHDALQVFDFAEQGMVTGKRSNTTVPPQALFLLNDPLLQKAALAKSKRILAGSSDPVAQSITSIYREAFQRNPTDQEMIDAVSFIQSYENQFELILEESKGSPSSAQTTESSQGVKLVSSESNSSQNVAAPEDGRGEDAEPMVDTTHIEPASSREAAMAALVQSLFASAEFRFVR